MRSRSRSAPREMHEIAEYGVAAHWRYKEGRKSDAQVEAKIAWLRQLMDWREEVSDAEEFVESLKSDVFKEHDLRLHPEGRHHRAAGRRDAARLRLPHPHRSRAPLRRRQGQRPACPARPQAAERRGRRDHDQQDQGRPEPRLAAGRQAATSRPPARARRSGSGSAGRSATRTSSRAGTSSKASCAGSASTTSSKKCSSTSRATPRSTTSWPRSATAASRRKSIATKLGENGAKDVLSATPHIPSRRRRNGWWPAESAIC